MKIDPNSPAFPFACQGPTTGPETYYGLSIRALIAKDLMAAFIAQGSDPDCRDAIIQVATRHNKQPSAIYAEMGCEAADALIAQLNKTKD